jgi:hypothetical protein
MPDEKDHTKQQPVAPVAGKKPYEPPHILMVEELEAVADDCTGGGKETSGAPAPGGGTCGFGSS